MLRIVLKNEEIVEYAPYQFTDYKYDGKCFVVIRGKQWVGIYNMDCVACVCYEDASHDLDEIKRLMNKEDSCRVYNE